MNLYRTTLTKSLFLLFTVMVNDTSKVSRFWVIRFFTYKFKSTILWVDHTLCPLMQATEMKLFCLALSHLSHKKRPMLIIIDNTLFTVYDITDEVEIRNTVSYYPLHFSAASTKFSDPVTLSDPQVSSHTGGGRLFHTLLYAFQIKKLNFVFLYFIRND